MADNPSQPPSEPPRKANPPLPSSGMTGRLKALTNHLPRQKGTATGKIVVMLSSVAKPPPAITQSIPMVAPPLKPPANIVTTGSLQVVRQPGPLPPKQVTPATPKTTTSPGTQLTSTTFVKLPPKTTVPGWSSLVIRPAEPEKNPQPLLPAKRSEPITTTQKKSGAQHIPPIKLNEPAADAATPSESIFLQDDKPATVAKAPALKTPEVVVPKAAAVEVTGPMIKPADKPATPITEAKSPQVAQPLLATEAPAEPKSVLNRAPVALTPANPVNLAPPLLEKETAPEKPAEKSSPPLNPAPVALTSAHPIHVAPPMLEKETLPEPPSEKLPQPHLPSEVKKNVTDAPESLIKAPALIPSEPLAPAKPLSPPKPPTSKVADDDRKKSTPIVVTSTAPKTLNVVETKPALKPAVMPKRAMPLPDEPKVETPVTPAPTEAKKPEAPIAPKPEEKPIEKKPETKIPIGDAIKIEDKKADEKKIAAVAAGSAAAAAVAINLTSKKPEEKPVLAKLKPAAKPEPAPAVPPVETKKAALPPTRAERARSRRLTSILIFWLLLVPATGVGLVAGSYYFGRDTRVEGQVIPPPGMTVNNEVWIVSDFRDLASGISEDLAAERTPLMQEIQERREHVQRVQADVAAREERIRLIQDEMQAAKDEITSLVKQSRDATQHIWDGEGAEIDSEYESKLAQLKEAIASRAKSLNLKYQTDDAFQSPEVWANAYRLALYEVPAGVDPVKEHQWLGDQMKQWRDFEKSLDDRKEALREKAAQLKLAPAPKITDLNAKIEDLNQRIDATASEEVPLKAELQQAQIDLVQAQAADQGLDDKYYKQLDSLPGENITKHLTVAPNGRFTWVEDEAFAEGENERKYWIFSRATRADGRQYWALGHISIEKNHKICLMIDPDSFISTKAILRPNLSPEEQEQ